MLLREKSNLTRLGDNASRMALYRYQYDAEIADCIKQSAPEVLVHTACAYGRSGEDPAALNDANVRFGLVLLNALNQVGRAVGFFNTASALAPAVSEYALSKYQFSEWGRHVATHIDCPIRFANLVMQHVYGAGDDAKKFSTHLLHKLRQNTPEFPLTPGMQQRDFIYIDDVISAFDCLLAHHHQLGAYTDIALGTGQAPTVREFAETAHSLLASTTQLKFGAIPYRSNEAMHCVADPVWLREHGWKAKYNIADGLTQTIHKEFSLCGS